MLAAIFVLACSGVRVIDAPPPRIAVVTTAAIASALVQRMTDEADAVWNPGGITFVWQRAEADHPAADVLVIVDDVFRPPTTSLPALGWTEMRPSHLPMKYLHLSYTNIVAMLGDTKHMPPSQRDTYLGRALGRVLAHELGHYLLASNSHARNGLMRASLSPATLFGPGRATLDMPASACDARPRNVQR
jgi:hypothetical protein